MLVDREGLWFRVLTARYEVERGRLRVGGQSGSTWWREIARIREGSELGGSWFGEHVSKRVGDGSNTFFWTDPWVEGIPLCERFGRLFDLSENKGQTVVEMFSLGWGVAGEVWQWRRQLWVWEEEMLRECQTLLLNISLQVQSSDRWQWKPDPDEGYTVRGAYQFLTSQVTHKNKLVTRGILSPAAHFCVSDCGEAESAHHLFISCSTFGSIWTLVCSWIGITPVSATSIRDHFVQKKSSLISRLDKQFPSVVGQDQTSLF
ncbi:hypothetical protein TSUD_308770 [Trifolium subterraneum]|nr:hypothetical protein TSUD_308770 [Trifolium subterraneum]